MDNRQFVIEQAAKLAAETVRVRDEIFEYAELPFKEFKSAALYAAELKKYGFETVEGAAEIPTCVYGWYKHGEGGMTFGFLGEYDALDSLSQKAGVTDHDPVTANAPGHGCGHCCLGAGSLEAAVIMKNYLVENDIPGKVYYFGCPAEEGAGAKQFMARAGLFDDCDFIYTWHPAASTAIDNAHCNAIMGANFYFKGRTAHAGGSPHLGRSALDACELMSVGCNYLHEHMIPEARVHYAYIDAGGTAPNVVQDHACVRYEVRAPYVKQVKELYERVCKVARGAAMMTETEVEIELAMAFTEYMPNKALAPIVSEAMEEIGAPEWSEDDYILAKAYLESFPEETKASIREMYRERFGECWEEKWNRPLDDTVTPYDPEKIRFQAGSTDVGDVCCAVPCVNLNVATNCIGNVGHTWQMTGQSGSSLGEKGMLTAAKVMALAAIKTLERPEAVEAAKKEVLQKNGGRYVCPLPPEVKPPIDTY